MIFPLKIAVLEDHRNFREALAHELNEDQYFLIDIFDCDALDETLAVESIDIVILDLPQQTGLGITNRLKAVRSRVFIIMLMPEEASEDRTKGYDHGSDLCISKPASPQELAAAIRSYSKRMQSEAVSQTHLHVAVQRLELIGSKTVSLNRVELILLKALIVAPEQRMEYFRLLELFDAEIDAKGKAALEVHITRLRKKLIDAGARPPAIRAIRNEGYQLVERLTLR